MVDCETNLRYQLKAGGPSKAEQGRETREAKMAKQKMYSEQRGEHS